MGQTSNRKEHWEAVYLNKPLETVGWYQPVPETSLSLIARLNLPKEARIIDIGGGDSLLTDHLLRLGYRNLTVLDISEAAIKRAQKRLGALASGVEWIVSDVLDFTPGQCYDLWHDRAAFHFLTSGEEQAAYLQTATHALCPGGNLIVGTFSDKGPTRCSGLEIQQYSPETMERFFSKEFNLTSFLETEHHTPGGSIQHYLFGTFAKPGPSGR